MMRRVTSGAQAVLTRIHCPIDRVSIYIYDHLNYVLYIESYVRVMQALMEPCVAITSQRARCTVQKA